MPWIWLIDYTLTVVWSLNSPRLRRWPSPDLAHLLCSRSVRRIWIGSVDPTPPKPLLAFNSPGDTPLQPPGSSRCTRARGHPRWRPARGVERARRRCRAPRGWRCCCARRGRPRYCTARWAPTGPPTSHARGPRRRPPPPRRRWVRT